MLRKLQKREGQRRSPRISALEGCLDNGTPQGPAFRTRGKKKTKLRPLQQLKGEKHKDIQKKKDNGQPSKSPSTLLPEKRILELVLDTLQRRDTYEIFAEPVDPNEVGDYYAIIKEPMDFGTMRAKLHEGMYKTLKQFEHDVFLIFDNAMHFNSSSTIYFRQARVISEVAKKVFEALRINPEKFEMELTETRQQVGRRNQGDSKDSTQMESSKTTNGTPSKNVSCSSHGTPARKVLRTNNHGCSETYKRLNARDVEVPISKMRRTKDSSKLKSFEVDRRCTYRPLSQYENESIFSTVHDRLKLLQHVNQQDIGYKDSLMLFVKDLGPTAQKIAKRKLLGCEVRTAFASAPQRLDTFSLVPASSSAPMSQNPLHKEKVERILNAEKEKGCASPLDGTNTQGNNHMWPLWGSNKVFAAQSSCSNSQYSSKNETKETGNNSRMMLWDKSMLVNQEQLYSMTSIQDKCQTNNVLEESRLENNCKFQSRHWLLGSSSGLSVSCLDQDRSQMQKSSFGCPASIGTGCSFKGMRNFKSDNNNVPPLASSFGFNLPYLKTRLDQINSLEKHKFLQ